MKKSVLVVLLGLFASCVMAQTSKLVIKDSVIYQNNQSPIYYDSLATWQQTVFANFLSMVDSNKTPIPIPLKSIQVKGTSKADAIVTISGQSGFPVTYRLAELTGSNALTKDSVYLFVQQSMGVTITSLIANFDGTKTIKINGQTINYDYADSLSGGILKKAEDMCYGLLNGKNP